MIILGNTFKLGAVFSALVMLLTVGLAEATPLAPDPNNPDLVVEGQGLTIIEAGVGLEGLGGGTRNISINIGGPVEHALLYWAGRQRPCDIVGSTCGINATPYRDQELIFDGTPIEGVVVGEESQLSADGASGLNVLNIGYRADVTSIVAAKGVGPQSFDIADGDTGNNLSTLSGAGLVVIYTDPADTEVYKIMLFDGLDFAFGRGDQIPEAQVTAPVHFNHGAADSDRTADLIIFVGDATPNRRDRIDITDAFGTTTQIVNQLVSADGLQWDTLATTVNVPANGDTTTVQLFSEPFGQNPDSLLWILGALRIPVPQANPDIDIRKQEEGPDSRTFPSGSDVDFEIMVTNTGDVDLTNVEVTDPLVPGCANSIGDLAVGASFSYTCTAPGVTQSFTNEACVSGEFDGTTVTDCDPSTVEITPVGGEGCTPGYWRQPHHFDSWTGFTTDQKFSAVFGVEPFTVRGVGQNTITDPTLLEALVANGGGINALARHAVASLLNAASADVDFALTEAQVIALVQDAIASGDLEGAKDQLEDQNEQGCPLS
jgi:uncharacterized repeat protein (TIGR01451 family)